jgi:uncharacterized protein (TIGR03000 family)
VLHNWKRVAVPALAAALIAFIANPVFAGKGGGGGRGGRGGGGGGMRAGGFRAGPSGMSRGRGGEGSWNGRGNWDGRGWGREGGWDRGAWGWWGGGYYNPWYDGYGYGGYAYGGYPSDYSSFYSGPATYSEDATQGYADQASAGSMTANEDAAMIAVRVPPNAEIWFDGQKTNQKGVVRQFETPALDPGHDYTYEVRAQWNDSGRNVERTRHVTVHAGDRIGLNFMERQGRMGNDSDMRGGDQIRDRMPQNNAPPNRGNQPPRPGNVPPSDSEG